MYLVLKKVLVVLLVFGISKVGLSIFAPDVAEGSSSAKYTLAVGTLPVGGGSVAGSPKKASYTADTKVMLTATPNAEYRFVQWFVDGSGNDPSTTIAVSKNMTLTTLFVRLLLILVHEYQWLGKLDPLHPYDPCALWASTAKNLSDYDVNSSKSRCGIVRSPDGHELLLSFRRAP